jgi:integrase
MPGEGSVYRRKDGRWVAALSAGGRGDRTVYTRYWRTKPSREERTAALEELRIRAGLSAAGGAGTMTLGAFLRSWLDDSARPSISPNTYRGYDVIVRRHLAPLAPIPLRSLTAEQIEAALARMDAAPKTIRNVQLMLRRALRVRQSSAATFDRNVARSSSRSAWSPGSQGRRAHRRRRTRRDPRGRCRSDRYAAAIDARDRSASARARVLGLAWDDVDLRSPRP